MSIEIILYRSDYKDSWVRQAFNQTKEALNQVSKTFTIEELRSKVQVKPPEDNRWWGQVTTLLKKEGLIRRVNNTGRPAMSSNYSLKPVWEKSN